MKIETIVKDERIGTIWPLPKAQTSGSAGIDLLACIDDSIKIKPQACVLIPSGIAINIANPGVCGLLFPRSGLGHKQGLVLGNGTGVIDADYQGEIKLSVFNRSGEEQIIEPGMRIAQLVLVPIVQAELIPVEKFNITSERSEGGFGSTGIKETVD